MKNALKKVVLLGIVILTILGCNDDEGLNIGWCTVPESPYRNPVWHPSGDLIGFNHLPITEIDYAYGYDSPLKASYTYNSDSLGFWLINADGTNQRRVLPYYLETPAWSPDGNWIAFSQGAQIFKMPFDGENFDTTNIVQLTFQGRSFHPSWSANNEEIAYGVSICTAELSCGVWVYSLITGDYEFICKYARFPDWHPFSDSIIFLTNALEDGADVGDSLWLYSKPDNCKSLIKYIPYPYCDNRYLQYSPTGEHIAFMSVHNIEGGLLLYIINSDGSDFKILTRDDYEHFSWAPDGRHIVYLNYSYSRIDESKGALKIVNIENESTRQLTYNRFNLIL